MLPRPHKGKYISIASARQPVSDFPGSIRINMVKGKEHVRTERHCGVSRKEEAGIPPGINFFLLT